MTAHRRARRVPVTEPIGGWDYADAFEVHLVASDGRSPEQFARDALEGAPRSVGRFISFVHRRLARFRLGPVPSPDHIAGWAIVVSEPDEVRLEAASPLLRAVIVGRRPFPTRAVVTTCLFYRRAPLARLIWTAVGPLHRAIAPRLLDRAAAADAVAQPVR